MTDLTVPDVEVKINKQPLFKQPGGANAATQAAAGAIGGLGGDLLDITIEDSLDHASKFTLRINTWDLDKQAVSWADQIGVGAEVEIWLGYTTPGQPGSEPEQPAMLVGDILNLDVSFGSGKAPLLTVAGLDVRHRLSRAGKVDQHQDQKHSDIAQTMIQRCQLSAEVSDTVDKHPSTYQKNVTDLKLLWELADKNLFVVLARARSILFGPPPDTIVKLSIDPDLKGELHELSEFDARLNVEKLTEQIEVKWQKDQKDQKDQSYVEKVALEALPGVRSVDDLKRLAAPSEVLEGSVVKTEEEAKKRAKARKKELVETLLTASGKCPGNPAIRAGVILDVSGVGERFSKKYRVISATHSYSPAAGYVTSFQLKGLAS